jgi:uncharacterized Zn-binding protein involved in type VI secretion
MGMAARATDQTSHPGLVSGPGEPTVLIGGLPAAIVGSNHVCSFPPPPPHPPSIFPVGSSTVLIGHRGALRVGDSAVCGATIVTGCASVDIGG